mmetsp:Transcript_19998/g.41808  ORF Transcript_19998/g.41808 Transcript_19998/m.41808 type:complete len:235 (-) Transcript_19998:1006-1710(-)
MVLRRVLDFSISFCVTAELFNLSNSRSRDLLRDVISSSFSRSSDATSSRSMAAASSTACFQERMAADFRFMFLPPMQRLMIPRKHLRVKTYSFHFSIDLYCCRRKSFLENDSRSCRFLCSICSSLTQAWNTLNFKPFIILFIALLAACNRFSLSWLLRARAWFAASHAWCSRLNLDHILKDQFMRDLWNLLNIPEITWTATTRPRIPCSLVLSMTSTYWSRSSSMSRNAMFIMW